MAHSPSAKKRIRQNEKARLLNRRRKDGVKEVVREFNERIADGDAAGAAEALKAAYKKIDQISETNTIHKNTAARRKSNMARKLNAVTSK